MLLRVVGVLVFDCEKEADVNLSTYVDVSPGPGVSLSMETTNPGILDFVA
jgi:hypothetical protein